MDRGGAGGWQAVKPPRYIDRFPVSRLKYWRAAMGVDSRRRGNDEVRPAGVAIFLHPRRV